MEARKEYSQSQCTYVISLRGERYTSSLSPDYMHCPKQEAHVGERTCASQTAKQLSTILLKMFSSLSCLEIPLNSIWLNMAIENDAPKRHTSSVKTKRIFALPESGT